MQKNNTINTRSTAVFVTSKRGLSDLFILLGILAFGAFAVIGLYHTTILATMKLLPALFYTVIPLVTFFFAVGVTLFKDPIHNLLCLIAVFINTVLFYLFIGAEYLAFTFLIVYVGAIAILFVFVIMLLRLTGVLRAAVLLTLGFLCLALPTYVVTTIGTEDLVSDTIATFIICRDTLLYSVEFTVLDPIIHYITNCHVDILTFSNSLYTQYSLLFIITSFLLLTAMLGAIILATAATDITEVKWSNLTASRFIAFTSHFVINAAVVGLIALYAYTR